MRKRFGLIVLLLCICSWAYSQKLRINGEQKLFVDTTLVYPKEATREEQFNKVKKWLIIYTPEYNKMLKGEMSPDVISLLNITDYWALAGTRQKYSQDLNLELGLSGIKMSITNLRTYAPAENETPLQAHLKGYAAEKFFITKGGELRKNYTKFYGDVEQQFRELVASLYQYLKTN